MDIISMKCKYSIINNENKDTDFDSDTDTNQEQKTCEKTTRVRNGVENRRHNYVYSS